MKKTAFILVSLWIVISILGAPEMRAQNRPVLGGGGLSLDEEKVPVILAFGYGSHGLGFNLGLAFPNAIKLPGLEIVGEFCQNAQLGFEIGWQPVSLFTDGLYLHTGLEWQYEVKIITTDFHPTNQTFNGQDRMFVSIRIGPEFEVGRFGVGVYLNSGQTWIPSNNPSTQDWRWAQKVFGRVYWKF
ncbi:MAG: hypothetical protein WC264_00045 [Candidatus Paceibacterota bacterium]|jgi:hypothetical protein